MRLGSNVRIIACVFFAHALISQFKGRMRWMQLLHHGTARLMWELLPVLLRAMLTLNLAIPPPAALAVTSINRRLYRGFCSIMLVNRVVNNMFGTSCVFFVIQELSYNMARIMAIFLSIRE